MCAIGMCVNGIFVNGIKILLRCATGIMFSLLGALSGCGLSGIMLNSVCVIGMWVIAPYANGILPVETGRQRTSAQGHDCKRVALVGMDPRTSTRTRTGTRRDYRRPACDILQRSHRFRAVSLQRIQPTDL